jgi:hypothetical protein
MFFPLILSQFFPLFDFRSVKKVVNEAVDVYKKLVTVIQLDSFPLVPLEPLHLPEDLVDPLLRRGKVLCQSGNALVIAHCKTSVPESTH